MRASSRIALILAVGGVCVFSTPAVAQRSGVATVESIQGEVRAGGAPVFAGQRIGLGARISTGRGAWVMLRFDGGARAAVGGETILVPADVRNGRVVLDLLGGGARVRGERMAVTLRTPRAQFAAEPPADFTVVASEAAYLSVKEGSVAASNAAGEASFAAGAGALARDQGSPPTALTAPPASAAASVAALAGLDLDLRAEEAAARAKEEAEMQRLAGPPPRQRKFWAGGALNLVGYDDNTTGRLLSTGEQDTSAVGFKVFAGYQFARNFGLEVAYVDLGKVDYRGAFQGMPVVDGELQITGFDVALVGSVAIADRVSVFAKGGVFFWEAEAEDVVGGVPFSTTTRNENILLGLGFNYARRPENAWRVEFEVRRTADEVATVLSVGYEFRF